MICKMNYSTQIKWRIRLLWAALIAMLVFMVVIGEIGARDSRVVTGLAYTLGGQMYWFGLLYVIVRLVINKKLQKDRQRLKAQQLHERDERNQHLHRMSGGWVMDAMLFLTYAAAVTASCFDNTAFYATFGLLAAAALLKGGSYIAYSRGWLRA